MLLILNICLVGCACGRFKKLADDKHAEEYTNSIVGDEEYELLSSKMYKRYPDAKKYLYRSKKRDLEFETRLSLEQRYNGLYTEWVTVYECTYYDEVYKLYKDQIKDTVTKYFSDDNYIYFEHRDNLSEKTKTYYEYSVSINNQTDIDNYIKILNEVNAIYSAETAYNSNPKSLISITAKHDDRTLYSMTINGSTDDVKDQVTDKIYQLLKDRGIHLEGVNNDNYHKKEIFDVYLNDHKMTYNEDKEHSVYIPTNTSYISHLRGDENEHYYIEIKESDGQSSFAQYLTVMNIPYVVDNDTITFTLKGKKYEISGKHANSGSEATTFVVLIDGQDYPVDYRKLATGYLYLNIDDFASILGLTYTESDEIRFTS